MLIYFVLFLAGYQLDVICTDFSKAFDTIQLKYCNIPIESHSEYSPILASLNLESLKIRRTMLALNFL